MQGRCNIASQGFPASRESPSGTSVMCSLRNRQLNSSDRVMHAMHPDSHLLVNALRAAKLHQLSACC